jgi:hypothetical protein
MPLPDLMHDLGQATKIPRHLETVHGHRANDVAGAQEQFHRLRLADGVPCPMMTQQGANGRGARHPNTFHSWHPSTRRHRRELVNGANAKTTPFDLVRRELVHVVFVGHRMRRPAGVTKVRRRVVKKTHGGH